MNQNNTQQNLLLWFLIISLLIHLILVFLSRQLTLFPEPAEPERVIVQMRSRELDIPLRPELDKPREKPAERLAEQNQVVEEEMAPKGDSTDDMRPDSAAPPVQQPQQKVMAPQPEKAEPKAETKAEPKPQGTRPSVVKQEQAVESVEKAPETPPQEQAQPVPDLNSLLQLPQTTVARMEDQWRQKYRDNVKEGDAVWLDTEQDILSSFFRRLRNGIYNVWNYPASAARAGQEGVCLLSMTFLKDGTLKEVKLLESSGTPILDKAAIAAVRKGGPYGSLPRIYEKDKLTIMASFRYDLKSSRTKGAGIY